MVAVILIGLGTMTALVWVLATTLDQKAPRKSGAGPFESEYVFDLPHGHSLRWHPSLLHNEIEAERYEGEGGLASRTAPA